MYCAQHSGNYKFFDNNLGIWHLASGERGEAKKLVVWVAELQTHTLWRWCGVYLVWHSYLQLTFLFLWWELIFLYYPILPLIFRICSVKLSVNSLKDCAAV